MILIEKKIFVRNNECNSSTLAKEDNGRLILRLAFSASDPITRQCPNLGRYEIVSVLHSYNSVEDILGVDGEQNMANAAEVQDVRVTSTPYPGRCRYGSVRRLDIGCKTPDRMEFATCSDETPSGKILGEFFFFKMLIVDFKFVRIYRIYSSELANSGEKL